MTNRTDEAVIASEPANGVVVSMFHAGISVSDLDRSEAFYTQQIGLELLWKRDAEDEYLRKMHGQPFTLVRLALLRVPGSDTTIELLEYQGVERTGCRHQPSDPGTGHVCFYVRDIDVFDARLRAAGVLARSSSPVQITAGRNRGCRAVYFHDPDGYPVELIERPDH